MKQYGTAPGQNNYTPDFLQHFDQKDGGKIIIQEILKEIKTYVIIFQDGLPLRLEKGPRPSQPQFSNNSYNNSNNHRSVNSYKAMNKYRMFNIVIPGRRQ